MASLCVFLTMACIYDYLRHKIPNWLLLLFFALGLGQAMIWANPGRLFLCLVATAAVAMLTYPLFKIGCIGGGDVKLLGVCAGYFPIQKIPSFLFFSLLVAAIFSLIKMLKEHNAKERLFYLADYTLSVLRSGKWKLYTENNGNHRSFGICLSGPVFLGALLCMGGAG